MSQLITYILILIAIIMTIVMVFILMNAENIAGKIINENVNEKPTVKIGVLLPLTGSYSLMGNSSKVVTEMAINDINNMNTKYNYDIIIEDDRSNSKGSNMGANKLVNTDKVSAIVPWGSRSFAASKVFSNEGKIINVGCSWGDSMGEGKYNFNTFTESKISTKIIVNEMQKKGLKNVGMLIMETPGGDALSKSFKNSIETTNLNISFEERVKPGETNFRDVVWKMTSKDIDILFVALSPTSLEILLKEMFIQKIDFPITSINMIGSVSDRRLVEGDWYVSLLETKEEFKKRYNQKTNVEMQTCAPQIYNGIMILIEAFEKSENLNIENVIKFLYSIKQYEGVTGLLEASKTNFNQKDIPIMVIKNGKSILLEE